MNELAFETGKHCLIRNYQRAVRVLPSAIPRNYLVYRAILDSIKQGDYKEGDKLPSIHLPAELFGVSKITVQHAIRTLKKEGPANSERG